jgi:hypothetical protein
MWYCSPAICITLLAHVKFGECSSIPVRLQAIERQGTHITYLQLLYSMTQALEQLHASQGNRPPKLPPQVGGLFGGLVNKVVKGALDFAGLSGQTPVMCSNVPFDLNRAVAL